MTRPKITGTLAISLFERIVDEARQGRREALDGLYLILGDDDKAAIEQIKTVIERFELIERVMAKMSQQQIHQAAKLLEEETE